MPTGLIHHTLAPVHNTGYPWHCDRMLATYGAGSVPSWKHSSFPWRRPILALAVIMLGAMTTPCEATKPGGANQQRAGNNTALHGKHHPVHHRAPLSHGQQLALDPGCMTSECEDAVPSLQPHATTGRAAVVMSLCHEKVESSLARSSCDHHDFVILLKCGVSASPNVPEHLAPCTDIVDLSWCQPGRIHCSNFYFLLAYYDKMHRWDVVYLLKGRFSGGDWDHRQAKGMPDLQWMLSQHVGTSIGFESYGRKTQLLDVADFGKHWRPVARWVGCRTRATVWRSSPRSTFAVSSKRILGWPKCKYQWLLHTLFFPPKGIKSTQEIWHFFEFAYNHLFTCRFSVRTKEVPIPGFPGFKKPGHLCLADSTDVKRNLL
mmetsp:Transcript_45621/g.116730  ORF Transcript_45621/g.116730 Transcript_45621/m.116730 type:complete len:375 (+) Transcript_45621:22-1146(+)